MGGHNFKGEVPQADQLATVAGQQALGNCPEQIHAQDSGSWGCANAAGQSNSSMTVAPV